MRKQLVAMVAALTVLLAGCGNTEEAEAKLPKEFYGVAPQDELTGPDFSRLALGNVGSYHVLVNWSQIESTKDSYNFDRTDAIFEEVAKADVEPIVYIFGTPQAYGATPSTPPTRTREAMKAYKRFARSAVIRYGPRGEYWDEFAVTNPGVRPKPVHIWEIWNEENGVAFWQPEPSPKEYGKLLRVSDKAITAIDRNAQIMVGGMFATPSNKKSIDSIPFLKALLKKKNVKKVVDLVAAHPYGPELKDVKKQVAQTYRVMKQNGLGSKGMWITEIGWGSDPTVRSALAKTEAEQAKLLKKTYGLFKRKRNRWNIEGALWYTWRDPANQVQECGWCAAAGLFDADFDAKQSWIEFTKLTGGKAG